jgi:prophage tail gpP-like protein
VGSLVNLDYPTCRIFEEDLLITDVTLSKSDQGTLAQLTLKRPDIYLAASELVETKEILQAHKAATKAQKQAAKSKK